MTWVTLEEAKHHLRYDDDSNDVMLTAYIAAAESAVMQYITKTVTAADTPDIKVAVLMLIGYFDDNRNADKETPTNGNYLPAPVISMLYPYRTPTAV